MQPGGGGGQEDTIGLRDYWYRAKVFPYCASIFTVAHRERLHSI